MRGNLLTRAFLDERLVPELESGTVQYCDHIRRYLFAQQHVYGKRVLDIACGTGYGSDILRRGGAHQVVSMDISTEALHYAAARWRSGWIAQADAQHIPLPTTSLDVIVTLETLEHLPDPRAYLAEAKRILSTGGCLILSVPNRLKSSPGSETPHSPYHTFEPTRQELLTLLQENGWTVRALHGITHSERIQHLVRPTHEPFQREVDKIAWAAYVRQWVQAVLPGAVYEWSGRVRNIPRIEITDSILTQEATEESSYFVALCVSA
jgi:ubiquinone/menaquinone biosynthesis C-methylase UbiE